MAMAEVPEFSDFSMEYSEDVEEFYADDLSFTKKTNKTHLQWKHQEDCWSPFLSGVKSEIRKPGKAMSTFRKAIMLVVVVEKLKGKSGSDKQNFFDDDDLLNHILVEEDITCDEMQSYEARISKFQYNKTSVHIIRDHRQKCLALQQFQDQAHLVALFLQGQNIEREAKINVNSYVAAPFDANKRPVTLGIADSKFYLHCTAKDGAQDPELCLKEVENIRDIKNDDLLPFMFFKKPSSSVYNSFESVAFPGYCISTSKENNEQVQLKPENNQVYLTDFIVNPNF